MEDSFWNSLPLFLPQEPQQFPISDYRFSFEAPDEDVWIPSDQTIHWGKRPHSVYPCVNLLKREDLPQIPRGSRLVAKLLYADWTWDDGDTLKNSEMDPAIVKCLEEDKIMVPFEKNAAVFRHLRVSKSIKLKGTESLSIRTLACEIGYHNPYSECTFRSLDIILTKEVKIHIVAHKGSVGFMKKHGLAKVQAAETKPLMSLFAPIQIPAPKQKAEKADINAPIASSPRIKPPLIINLSKEKQQTNQQSGNTSISSQVNTPVSTSVVETKVKEEMKDNSKSDLKRTIELTAEELSQMKKQKTNQLAEILDELALIQSRTELLKKKIGEFLNTPVVSVDKTIQITAPEQYSPNNFIFYAFRRNDLELGVSLIRAYNFDIVNTRDPKGYTLLHTAAKSSFLEGVRWCLEHGAPVNATTNHQSTALHFAYQRGNSSVINLLKQHNADEDAINVYGLKPKDYHNQRKPLANKTEGDGCVEVVMPGFERPFKLSVWFAARIGWLEVVTLYVGHLGFDVDTKTPAGVTPLMCACEYNRYDVVEYLLQMGADPNARDIYDRTALHYAYVNYNQDIIRILEQSGADSTVNNIWNHQPTWYKDSKVST